LCNHSIFLNEASKNLRILIRKKGAKYVRPTNRELDFMRSVARSKKAARQSIGKYEILAKLGEGAMGVVYKGVDPATECAVAVKVAAISVVRDKVLLQRFEQEYRSTSHLCHPNLVRGLDFGWDRDRPFIVFEFVEGEDLWTRIERQGALPEAEALDIIRQVAEGLHEAHKHGIIHRDIKPDNILLTNDGQVKLTDLGLCKDLEGDANLTRPGHGLGTPNFIAPEQFGDARNASVACDIYSLGTTLYMALTGRLPFDGPNLSTIMKLKLTSELVSPRTLAPTLSEHVEWAVRRSIQADPTRRHASCPEFIAALTGEAALSESKRQISSEQPGNKAKRTGAERRRALRFDCALPTSCVIDESLHAAEGQTDSLSSWEAQVCSLSVSGIGLFIKRRFEPGSVLTVVLTSRSGSVKETREMRVVRAVRATDGGWFVGGMLSEHLTKEELRNLL
jgi:serine/threonine protein kinase